MAMIVIDAECPNCSDQISIEIRSGWPYVYSQIVTHLNGCAASRDRAWIREVATNLATDAVSRSEAPGGG